MLPWQLYFTCIEQCNPKNNVIPRVNPNPKVNIIPRSILSQNSYAFFNALLFLKKFGAELTCALEGDAVLPFLD